MPLSALGACKSQSPPQTPPQNLIVGGGSCFCAPPLYCYRVDMGVLMHPIPYGGMWEGVGGSSDPHPIVGGGEERGEGGVLLLCPPPISL